METNCNTCKHDGRQWIFGSKCTGCCPQDQPTYIHYEPDSTVSVESEVDVKKGEHEKPFIDFRDYVLEKEKEGKIVILTPEGVAEANLDNIIKQPAQGLLYDLNRSREVILTFIDDKKWVNDFACMKVIEKLKALFSD